MTRTLTLWCPGWPLVALDPEQYPPGMPVAVFVAEQVLACFHAAPDQSAGMRAFEPVLTALENICPQLEVVRPGLCLFDTKGPGHYFGGDVKLAGAVIAAVSAALPETAGPDGASSLGIRIGIADGPFAAGLAARRSPAADRPTIVGPGRTPAFLAPFPVSVLQRPDLADLFERLGLRTLGDLAALPIQHMASRFGTEGRLVHRLACGQDDHLLRPRAASTEFDVHQELDPPEEQIEPLAFVAKVLADRLQSELVRRGLGCTRLLVEAKSEHGESRSRLWRQDEALTPAAVAQRVRWQLEGWLTGPADHRPHAGIVLLRLTPSGLHHEDGEQLHLFGGPTDTDERATAAVTRLQALLGFDAVYVPIKAGGRNPVECVRLAPWGEHDTGTAATFTPWPGRLPAPNPTVLYPDPLPATVVDGNGATITLDGRGIISADPQGFSARGGQVLPIADWAGPWFVNERWWAPTTQSSIARLQLVTANGAAQLVVRRDARWWVEGTYD